MLELPKELIDALTITQVTPLSGGDIAKAYRLDTTDGPYFLKTHPQPKPHMFEREAQGLEALRAAAPGLIGVPEVVGASSRGLVLEWIDEGRVAGASESELGQGLALLHQQPGPHFGGLDGDAFGYLGSVAVDLTPTDSWAEFYVERRLRPLVAQAVKQGGIAAEASELFERAAARAEELCGPDEPPALLHGDLWGGNRLVDAQGHNWLIDPAAFYGHREVDLAMMRLFGGFGEDAFDAYHATYPLERGWQERISWYQLAPLLVHAILFGGGYGGAALRVLGEYV